MGLEACDGAGLAAIVVRIGAESPRRLLARFRFDALTAARGLHALLYAAPPLARPIAAIPPVLAPLWHRFRSGISIEKDGLIDF
jgi:hypothetical protein